MSQQTQQQYQQRALGGKTDQTQAIALYNKTAEDVSLAEYYRQGCNVLSPTPVVVQVDPFHKVRLNVVQLSLDERDRDVYYSKTFCKKDERALSKNGLIKLARAAGLREVPHLIGQTDDRKDPLYVSFRVVLEMRGPDGQKEPFTGHKEVDLRPGGSVEAGLRKQAQQKLNGSWNDVTRKMDGPPEFKTQAQADAWVQAQIAAASEHKLSNCETKAYLRAVRKALTIKPAYTLEELSRPFVIPVLAFSPDFGDPEIKRVMLNAFAGAQAALYGADPTQALPPAEDIAHAQRVIDAMENGGTPAGFSADLEIPQDGPEPDESGDMDFGDDPPHDGHTGEVIDPLHDALVALDNADRQELGRLSKEYNAANKAGKYSKDQWTRLFQAASQRDAALKAQGA